MELQLPELGEGVLEAELVAWRVQVGDVVRPGQPLAEVLTDKASIELPSPFAGEITALQAKPGEVVAVGGGLLSYQASEDATPSKSVASDAGVTSPQNNHRAQSAAKDVPDRSEMYIVAAPSVRRRARELGIDLAKVNGSGRGGRILKNDLTEGDAETTDPSPDSDALRPGMRLPFTGVRRKVAEQMVRSKETAVHYSYFDECDVTELVRLRESLKADFAEQGVKLTYIAFIVKAVAAALREVPLVNATLDDDAGEIILHDQYHIGVAMATDQGLIVPVVRDVDRRDITSLATEIQRLADNARTGKSKREDLQGSTFTVTSIGNLGGLASSPIINYPEVGILGAGKIVRRPVYDEQDNLRPADMMYLSFSFDHRVVDGAVGVTFGNAVIRRLANPARLLIAPPEVAGASTNP